jgi:hypothetical protein
LPELKNNVQDLVGNNFPECTVGAILIALGESILPYRAFKYRELIFDGILNIVIALQISVFEPLTPPSPAGRGS